MSELQRIFRPTDEGKPFGEHEFPCSPDHIRTDPKLNIITFEVQEGPIKENGVNGCQIDHMIWAVAEILRFFNKRFPCRENSCAITHLDEAMMWLEKRTKDRTDRGVEGKNQK